MIKTKRFTTNDQQAVDVHKSLVEELYANQRVPFMERGSYCTGHLAIESGGTPQAFATLFFNPAMRWKGERVACMGNVEMQNNPKMVSALLEGMENWSRDIGVGYLVGPMNGSTWAEYRFPLDNGPEAFFTEQLRKDEYPGLLEGAGMERISTYFSAVAPCTSGGKMSTAEAEKVINDLELEWQEIDLTSIERAFAEIHGFCLEAFQSNLLFTPIEEDDFIERYARNGPYIRERYVLLARNRKGKLVGLLFAMPNHFCTTELQLVVKTLAVSERYRQKNLASALGAIFMNRAYEDGCTKVYHGFIQSANNSSILSDKYDGHLYREYGLWAKELKTDAHKE